MLSSMSRAFLLVGVLVTLVTGTAFASTVGFDVLAGTSVHSTGNKARIGQYLLEPEWETRAFSEVPYYSIRFRWAGHEMEWVHDKIYLTNPPAGIEDFSISDGYNLLLYNVPQKWGGFEARVGLGVVIGHAEGVVDGYYIGELGAPSWQTGGIAAQVALGYRAPIWNGLSWLAETKLTTGMFSVKYPNPVGEVNVPLTGYHILIGLGYDL